MIVTTLRPSLRALLCAGAAWLVLAALGLAGSAHAQVPVPPLSARVTDLTQTLSVAEQQALEAKLTAFGQKMGGQFVVLMVPTTQPEPIETYSLRVAEAWKIGRKGQDNGLLLVVAKNDRKLRFEVGYGYEGVLPDVVARRIIGDDIAPKFREGKYAEGINAGVDRAIAVIEKGEPPAPQPAPNRGAASALSFDPAMLVLLVFVVVPVVGGILKAIFGKVLGSVVGGGVVGAAAWFVAGSLVIAGIAGFISLLIMLFAGAAGGLVRGGGGWIPPRGGGGFGGGGFGGGGGFSGGGGFGGGGGSFGGGGASGDW
jgi:uncharacterized protein